MKARLLQNDMRCTIDQENRNENSQSDVNRRTTIRA